MYSVIRFVSGNEALLKKIGTELNIIRPRSYDGIDRIGGRFSCSVSKLDSWYEHSEAILVLLTELRTFLASCKKKNIELVVDLAVEPEDYHDKPWISLGFDYKFMSALVRNGVEFEITYYAGA